MKITRKHAIEMFHKLGTMALGHLNEASLEAVMDNIDSLRSTAEGFDKLTEELGKRLYDGQDKEKVQEFFGMLQKMQGKELAEMQEIERLARETYPELYALRLKEVAVTLSLRNKEVDLDVKKIDAREFKKAAIKAKPTLTEADFVILAPMFKEEEKKVETDLSELDEFFEEKAVE